MDCPTCEQTYHASCWTELGGCATYGCKKAVPAEKPAPRATAGGWGDSKRCPNCFKKLGTSLLICSCGARFPYADPMEPAEYKSWAASQNELRTSRRVILALFFVTLLGLPAPICGPIAGFFAYRRRDLLAGADGTYLAMAYGAAALGLTYAAVILALMGSAILGA